MIINSFSSPRRGSLPPDAPRRPADHGGGELGGRGVHLQRPQPRTAGERGPEHPHPPDGGASHRRHSPDAPGVRHPSHRLHRAHRYVPGTGRQTGEVPAHRLGHASSEHFLQFKSSDTSDDGWDCWPSYILLQPGLALPQVGVLVCMIIFILNIIGSVVLAFSG